MATTIGGAGLESVSLTTIAEVKLLLTSAYASTESDPLIESFIITGSEEITRYLGFHTLLSSRTETYHVRHGKRILTLDGRFVTGGLTSIKTSDHPTKFDTAVELLETDYVLHDAAGWIRFMCRQANWDYYVRVTYSSGLGANAAAVVATHKQISYAAALQVKYFLQRRDSPGGNITTLAGGATSFNGQYAFLREVRSILDALRRGTV